MKNTYLHLELEKFWLKKIPKKKSKITFLILEQPHFLKIRKIFCEIKLKSFHWMKGYNYHIPNRFRIRVWYLINEYTAKLLF